MFCIWLDIKLLIYLLILHVNAFTIWVRHIDNGNTTWQKFIRKGKLKYPFPYCRNCFSCSLRLSYFLHSSLKQSYKISSWILKLILCECFVIWIISWRISIIRRNLSLLEFQILCIGIYFKICNHFPLSKGGTYYGQNVCQITTKFSLNHQPFFNWFSFAQFCGDDWFKLPPTYQSRSYTSMEAFHS